MPARRALPVRQKGNASWSIATYHHTLVARDEHTGELRQVRARPATGGIVAPVETRDASVAQLEAMPTPASGGGHLIGSGPSAGCAFVGSTDRTTFALRRNGFFAGAELTNDAILFDRETASAWELFRFVSRDAARLLLIPVQTEDAFAQKVQALKDEGKPICLHLGCGPGRIEGFLNIDKFRTQTSSADSFNFDFAERKWPIPDACVDYISNEDFIEQISQRNQLAFLAESCRVLKPAATTE
jgi:hypothetical protein